MEYRATAARISRCQQPWPRLIETSFGFGERGARYVDTVAPPGAPVTELERTSECEVFPPAAGVAADGTAGEGLHPGLELPRLLALSRARLRWVSDQLGDQIARQGLRGVVDQRWGINAAGDAVQLGEDVRALVVLEERERDRCDESVRRTAGKAMIAVRDRGWQREQAS